MRSDASPNRYIDFYANYYDDPVSFAYDIIGIQNLEKEQIAVMNAISKHNRVSVKSGHGIGKTAMLSFVCIWFLMTRPHCKIPMTAPTQHQLHDILMPEISKWIYKANLGQYIECTKTKNYIKGYEDTWFSVARSCRVPENLQGFHAEELLFIIDEASGVPNEIMEVIEGALTTPKAKLIMTGNPTKIEGTFFNSFHRDRHFYEVFTFSSEDSARVSKDYIEKMARYGKDTDLYRVRVKGEFPKSEPDTFIKLDLVENAVLRSIEEKWEHIEIGIDPARYGDDESVIVWRKGLEIQPVMAFLGINTVRLTGETAHLINQIRKEGYTKKIAVKIDDTGVGGGVTDQLQELKTQLNIDVIPVINNATPSNADYKDYGSQIWGEMKEALNTISIKDDNDLIAQLTTRKYKIEPDGKIKLERKEDMKKRKLPSPDRADALALCLAQAQVFTFDDSPNLKVETR